MLGQCSATSSLPPGGTDSDTSRPWTRSRSPAMLNGAVEGDSTRGIQRSSSKWYVIGRKQALRPR